MIGARVVEHHLTIESKPGRAPKRVRSRWSCSCGAHGAAWTSPDEANDNADEHKAASSP